MRLAPGYKTYISAAALFTVGGLSAIGVLDEETAVSVRTILEALGLASLRIAIYKLE